MEEQDQVEVPDITQQEETPEADEVSPTKSVKNFWERLDEVFTMNVESAKMRERVEEILEQFPEYEKVNGDTYKSFIFQPERISISSNDDPTLLTARDNSLYTSGHAYAERFSSFKINFKKALRNVKSIQLLSGVIPNAAQNIPDESVCFFYYKIRTTENAFQGEWDTLTNYGAGDLVGIVALNANYACKVPNVDVNPSLTYWQTTTQTAIIPWSSTTAYTAGNLVLYNNVSYICITNNTGIIPGEIYWIPINLGINPNLPNYYDLNPYHIYVVYFFPTFGNLPESEPVVNTNAFNRTFQDYNDLVDALNFCVTNIGNQNNTNATVASDITFQYNATLNKIQMIPNANELAAGYYYMPCGYADPNIPLFFNLPTTPVFFGINYPGIFIPQTTLNLRLGFTWNGVFPDPFSSPDTLNDVFFSNVLLWYLRPKNPQYALPWAQDIITFNSYPDLVNTASVRVYADITLGSTEDSSNEGGLLSIVPVNASNLGIGFYQNNFNNPLTKIPRNIPEIQIRMLTDNGLPFYLPNSATVLFELAIEYY